ncbi:MAG: DNA cytosine methyltransferase [Chitinophagaceae bacterium]
MQDITRTELKFNPTKWKSTPRRLTPRECARLQGFPDTFLIPVSDNQAYKQFGNSVVTPLIQAVGKNIVKELAKLNEPKKSQIAVY